MDRALGWTRSMDHADSMMVRNLNTCTWSDALRLLGVLAIAVAVAACGGGEVPADAPGTTGGAGIAPPRLDPNAAPRATLGGAPPTRSEVETLGYEYGTQDAPIHVIELSDFGCGFCKVFHDETFPTLKAEYVDTGKVFWRFIPFDVGMFPNATNALQAGVCAGEQGLILEASQLLFNRQNEWKRSGDVSAELLAIVTAGGVNPVTWTECIETGRLNQEASANTAMARRLGVRGTPTFFVDGYPIQGSLPLETFRQVFESVLTDRASTGPE